MSFLRKIFGLGPKVDVHELIRNGATLIDVRTPAEYNSGHAKGSTNIPLDKISTKIEKIKQLKKPVVLCCRSGMRSGQATSILKGAGIKEAYNGGPWNNFA
ncbi:MAG: rhodanese-like domain-containing protein [Bacteroidetes bacterium]|nr:rhodanese-like domain-containing protein [Bacteroidota bacterium]